MATLTNEGYLGYLFDIGDKLTDFTILVEQQGKINHINTISTDLRILFIDKSGKKCLIKEIEEILNIKIFVAIKYSIQEKVTKGLLPASLAEGLRVNQTNSVATWFDINQKTCEVVPILDALNRQEELFINDVHYSYKTLIETVADKLGGAHIDRNISDEKLMPHTKEILIGGTTMSDRAILDTCRSAINLINKIKEFVQDGKESDFIKIK